MKKMYAVLWLLLFASVALQAESASPATAAATQITLGQSIMALNGPWKFHIGDNPQWADPNFDDSAWQNYTVDPKHTALTAVQAIQSDALPGWQQHEHPSYTGYAWYRIRLQVPPDADSLALLMPRYVDDAYEVYVNGQKIGNFGRLDGWHAFYANQPKLFSVPPTALKGTPVTLAIRFWNPRYEALPSEQNLGGGLRGVPLLGPPELLRVFQQSVQERIGQTSRSWHLLLLTAACGAVGILSLFLFFISRRQREYLWAGISLIGLAIVAAATGIQHAQQTSIPLQLAYTVAFVGYFVGFLTLPLAAMHLLGVPRPLWRRVNYVVFAVVFAYGLVALGLVFGFLPPTVTLDRINSLTLAPYLPFILLLVAIQSTACVRLEERHGCC